jgi:hypothetical protein
MYRGRKWTEVGFRLAKEQYHFKRECDRLGCPYSRSTYPGVPGLLFLTLVIDAPRRGAVLLGYHTLGVEDEAVGQWVWGRDRLIYTSTFRPCSAPAPRPWYMSALQE